MNKLRKMALMGVLLIALLCTGCQKEQAQETEKKAERVESDGIQIGFSFDSFVIERWQRDRDIFVSAAKELGAEVLVQSAEGDLQEQIEQIRYFIDKRVDAIVVVAVDCAGLADVVKEAQEAGIYVVSYDRLILNADLDLLVTFNNEKVGELMGSTMVNRLPSGSRIICINGSESDDNVSRVQAGFHSVIDSSDIKVVYNGYCPNWEAEVAYDTMQRLLNEGTEFDGIMCGNDDLATMVYKALSERGLADGVVLVGQDADLSACQRIVNGWQTMTVYKSVEALAREAAMDTVHLIETGAVETESVIENGYEEVPAVLLTPVAVNKSNMDQVVINGGYHSRSEVYESK